MTPDIEWKTGTMGIVYFRGKILSIRRNAMTGMWELNHLRLKKNISRKLKYKDIVKDLYDPCC